MSDINRQKRREYERKYGKAFAMKKYREEVITAGVKQGARTAIDIIMYMTAYTLSYKLEFGSKRLCRIMEQIIDNIDAYNTGHLTHSDYETIKKEMNKLGFYMKGDNK